jgi:hypothetical protein
VHRLASGSSVNLRLKMLASDEEGAPASLLSQNGQDGQADSVARLPETGEEIEGLDSVGSSYLPTMSKRPPKKLKSRGSSMSSGAMKNVKTTKRFTMF